ncbi:MAG: isoprenylcysteine carboxylmethyltransferase family protein [Hyphomicrobiales bacterium]|nr:isoprenylcysteine carboxylmethyltransferase family protein [Hyphomicrobiales bacterium]
MDRLERMIPPPVVLLLIGAAMRWTAPALPAAALPGWARVAWAFAFGGAGAALLAAAVFGFFRARTTVDPIRIDRASTLVVDGVYRVSRNPIYLADALFLVAWAGWLASPLTLAGPAALVAYLTRFQIRPEERFLAAKFGARYEAYRAAVRRWA